MEAALAAPKGESLRKIGSFVLLGLTVVLLAHCSRSGGADGSSTSTASVAENTGATGLSIGVPECDDYIKKYSECVGSKVPEIARAQYRAAFDQIQRGWQQAAATPE